MRRAYSAYVTAATSAPSQPQPLRLHGHMECCTRAVQNVFFAISTRGNSSVELIEYVLLRNDYAREEHRDGSRERGTMTSVDGTSAAASPPKLVPADPGSRFCGRIGVPYHGRPAKSHQPGNRKQCSIVLRVRTLRP